jgi:hypothetical protein
LLSPTQIAGACLRAGPHNFAITGFDTLSYLLGSFVVRVGGSLQTLVNVFTYVLWTFANRCASGETNRRIAGKERIDPDCPRLLCDTDIGGSLKARPGRMVHFLASSRGAPARQQLYFDALSTLSRKSKFITDVSCSPPNGQNCSFRPMQGRNLRMDFASPGHG